MKAADQKAMHSLLNTNQPISVSNVIHCECYSTMPKLYQVTACVLTFIDILEPPHPNSQCKMYRIPKGIGCRIVRSVCKGIRGSIHGKLSSVCSRTRINYGDVGVGYLSFGTKHPLILDRCHY